MQILGEVDEYGIDNISNHIYKSQTRKIQEAVRSWEGSDES